MGDTHQSFQNFNLALSGLVQAIKKHQQQKQIQDTIGQNTATGLGGFSTSGALAGTPATQSMSPATGPETNYESLIPSLAALAGTNPYAAPTMSAVMSTMPTTQLIPGFRGGISAARTNKLTGQTDVRPVIPSMPETDKTVSPYEDFARGYTDKKQAAIDWAKLTNQGKIDVGTALSKDYRDSTPFDAKNPKTGNVEKMVWRTNNKTGEGELVPLNVESAPKTGSGKLPKEVSTAYTDAQNAEESAIRMMDDLEKMKATSKNGMIDPQAAIDLFSRHLGMTFGSVKNMRFNREIIDKHITSRPVAEDMQNILQKVNSGTPITLQQAQRMMTLGLTARQESYNKFRRISQDLKVDQPFTGSPKLPPLEGMIVNGHKFLGGDPAQESSWEEVK